MPHPGHWDNNHRADCWLVAKDGDRVVGWSALHPVPYQEVYSGVAEVSVYVAEYARGKGEGRALLNSSASASEPAGVRTLQGNILVENEASIALHSAGGIRTVGTKERIGRLYGRWRDTVFMERRSDVGGA
ncbi:uncharacterized protein METZ01_LOCUS68901 [marine metagenome]|uniref:N-acetyltransferase domain-containing protein n=1 Tax=marine metagenome TaxID=408172 RepID=A0A381TMN5_9ZZZZ|tara:strand:- start:1048 stop:1440 length:393 start_codon:yes stop_codon:yes gene_type:complete